MKGVRRKSTDRTRPGPNGKGIQIAAAITSHARIYMLQLMDELKEINCDVYYMDTDCFVVSGTIPTDIISNECLGYFKIEHYIKEGYFLAPKVYGILTKNDKFVSKMKGLPKN